MLEGWAGDLYGIPVDSTMEAMALGAQLEAMITDPVYEGKSLAGLIDLVREGDIPSDSHVLYAHLGGQPAINAYHRLWALGGWQGLRVEAGLDRVAPMGATRSSVSAPT